MREQAIKNIREIWGWRCDNWQSYEWEPLIELELQIMKGRN